MYNERESYKHLVEDLKLGNSDIFLTFEVRIHANKVREVWAELDREVEVYRVTDLDFVDDITINTLSGAVATASPDVHWIETIKQYWDESDAEEIMNDKL